MKVDALSLRIGYYNIVLTSSELYAYVADSHQILFVVFNIVLRVIANISRD